MEKLTWFDKFSKNISRNCQDSSKVERDSPFSFIHQETNTCAVPEQEPAVPDGPNDL